MKTLIGWHFTSFFVVFVGTPILIAGLFVAGKISPREMGYACVAVCLAAIIVLTLLLAKSARVARSVAHRSKPGDGPTTRKEILRRIRFCKVAIAVMLLIFVYALWATRNDPLLPRIVGAVINIAVTGVFVVGLKTQKAKLKE
jgi:hypothetical protein